MLRRIVAVATCAVLLAGCTAPTTAGTKSIAASPAQRSMQARWWEWAAAEPVDTNPVADRTGKADDCRSYMADVTGAIQLDGTQVSLERIEDETITFVAGPGNPVTDISGKTRGEACGLWARIDPPSAGEHKVRIHAKAGTFEVDVAYTLVVTAASQSAA